MSEEPIGRAKEIGESAVVIVGGTSGVGLAAARQFGAAGARGVALIARNPERGARAVAAVRGASPGAKVVFVQGDSDDIASGSVAFDKAREALGGVDALINTTAASYVPKLLFRTEPADIKPMLVQQALAPMIMSRLALPHMREQKSGVIVNVASDAAKVPTPGESVVGAAMAAIVCFSRTLAVEAKRDGIRVNVLTPSRTYLSQWATTRNHSNVGLSFAGGRNGTLPSFARSLGGMATASPA
jgi:2-hydroxycyclohexanecarboxyl-CoA dehydrogenase